MTSNEEPQYDTKNSDPKDLTSTNLISDSLRTAVGLVDLGYKSVLDLLPCYLSIQDRSLRILFTNQTFRNDFGDGTGKLCHMVYKGAEKRCETCPVQKTFSDKGIHINEETVLLANGGTAQMIVYSAPILDVFGNVAAVIEMSTNITKVKEMQKELTFLGQSMAILSHDIKNILEGLQGGAYVVDEGIKDNDAELTQKGWEIVKKNINEVSSVVQNILYSSKKRAPEFRKISPDEIARSVVALFQEKAKAMGVELKHQSNPSLPFISLDPSGIRRMLSNLIMNAMEACEKDKNKDFQKVVVRADFYDKSHFKFEVEDNGIGMDETTRANLFKEFYSTKGFDGTGLGLMVAHKIVKDHGGRVEVLTAPGRGSTFRVILEMK